MYIFFRWLDEYHENEKFHFDLKYWKDKQNESKSRKVIVIYKDGTVEKYKSVKKAASSINIPKSRAHLIINDKIVINNDGTIITMRFIEDYNVNETIDWTDPKEYKEQKAVILVNTGEIFSSTVDAAEKLGLSYKAIWRVCNGDRKTYGFMPNGEARIFRWLDEYDESEKISLDKEYYKTELYKKKMKKVIRLNDQKIYDSIKEADEDNLGVSFQSISLCCLRKTNSAGTMTDGNLMVWRFLDDYDPNEIVSFKLGTCKKVRCITTGEIFDSVSEAASKYGIKNPSQISSCCKKKMKYKTAGQYNGVRLEWEYFEK